MARTKAIKLVRIAKDTPHSVGVAFVPINSSDVNCSAERKARESRVEGRRRSEEQEVVLQEQQVLQTTTTTTFSNGLCLWKLVGGVFGGAVAGFSLAAILVILKRSRKSAAASQSSLRDDGGGEIRSGGLCCGPTFSETIHVV